MNIAPETGGQKKAVGDSAAGRAAIQELGGCAGSVQGNDGDDAGGRAGRRVPRQALCTQAKDNLKGTSERSFLQSLILMLYPSGG